MKKNLQKKLANYSAAAGATVLAIGNTNAQVIYTDVNPDFVHPGGNVGIGLDLNNDAVFDFAIYSSDTTVSGTQYEFTVIAPYGTVGNEIAGETPSGYDYALALNSGAMIDASLNWIAATNTMTYRVNGTFPYGENWNGVTDKYLALKFNVGGNTHYGWARMDASGDTWTLKDYAYNSGANGAITAGQMPFASVETMDLESLVHFINQPNNTIDVRINTTLTNGEIKVVSMSGQIVSSMNINSNVETIDMNGLAAGIYMINVISVEGTITKKMVVR